MKKEEFNQIKYQNEFKKRNYDRFELVMPKGQKEVIKQRAKAVGQSLSEYINTAIAEKMEKGQKVGFMYHRNSDETAGRRYHPGTAQEKQKKGR